MDCCLTDGLTDFNGSAATFYWPATLRGSQNIASYSNVTSNATAVLSVKNAPHVIIAKYTCSTGLAAAVV